MLEDRRVLVTTLPAGFVETPFVTSGISNPTAMEFAPDGRLFVAGGHIQTNVGLAKASIYNPSTNTWAAVPDMNAGRWYPTVTTLANGDALVVWMETTDAGETSIRARHVSEHRIDPSFQVAAASVTRASGFPRLACFETTLYFAWTEAASPSRVHLASLDLPGAWR